MKTEERIDGPTPAGGAYLVAYFKGADGAPCDKEDAVAYEVIEYDRTGRTLRRTYMHHPQRTRGW